VLVVVLGAAAAAALVLVSARASLTADPSALARIGMPLGGGTIESVSVVTGPHARKIPVDVRGQQLWPRTLIPAHELVSIEVVVKRPGWVAWLAGKTVKLRLSLRAPTASLVQHYLTLRAGAPLRLEFKQPIQVIAYGPPGQLHRHVLPQPRSDVVLARISEAGEFSVAAAPRTWETSSPSVVSWFPAGAAASAVASPAPGTQILPNTPITLTFSKPVANALGSARPPVSPATQGAWHPVNSHTIVFKPEGYGYGLSTKVNIALPSGARLVGGAQTGSASAGTWTVPPGSTLRLQQILAGLGYLPLQFNTGALAVAPAPQAQEAAAIHPPKGSFSWKYGNVPASLKGFWQPGAAGIMTQGALMAFENDHGLTTDGIAGPAVWRALIGAAVADHRSAFGYTYVTVSTGSQSLNLWHNGNTVLSTPVNTGIASAPTATGTYPVYEHISSGTMSGTNPDGSHYSDPGIQFISYFNGGDALHAFTRAQYGFPQSLGCVEMQLGPAGQVFPYTPIGTLVHVE
jgi:peptidoglycan hydrolase-like protein with peptidoglycan-binding domain